MSAVRWSVALALLVSAALAASPANADPKKDAETAFRAGRKLLEAGDIHAACKKFEESQSLDPSAGTQLNLAGCYEKEGKSALAYATYRAAYDAAQARSRADWMKTAKTHADALEAKLPKLVVRVPDGSRVPGLVVKRDGDTIDPASFGAAVPVDPGAHVVEASAPGYKAHRVEVSVKELTTTAVIPALEKDEPAPALEAPAPVAPQPETPPAPVASPPPEDTTTGSTQRTLGIVTGGVGVAALAFGGVAALVGKSSLDDAKSHCASYPDRCSSSARDSNDKALSWFGIGTAAGIAGVVLVGAGAALYLTAPRVRVGIAGTALVTEGTF
jgi:hypothetical protein